MLIDIKAPRYLDDFLRFLSITILVQPSLQYDGIGVDYWVSWSTSVFDSYRFVRILRYSTITTLYYLWKVFIPVHLLQSAHSRHIYLTVCKSKLIDISLNESLDFFLLR